MRGRAKIAVGEKPRGMRDFVSAKNKEINKVMMNPKQSEQDKN